MNIRVANINDASSLAALSIEVWLGTYIRNGINAFFADYVLEEYSTQKLTDILLNDNGRVFVSENAEGIDGLVQVSHDKASAAGNCSNTEISKLYVQPRHQGKQIGTKLLEAALEYCVSCGVDTPWLTVNSENTGALSFYEKFGFQNIGQTHFSIQDQNYLNEVLNIDLQSLGNATLAT